MKNNSLLRSDIVGLPVGFIVGGLCVTGPDICSKSFSGDLRLTFRGSNGK